MLVVVFLNFSCATRLSVISDDITPMELIQRGQESWNRNRFTAALHYYSTLIERFPETPEYIEFIIAAEYEIALMHERRREFDTARVMFNDILARYDSPDAELLPPQFRVLSLIVLDRITELENRGRFRR